MIFFANIFLISKNRSFGLAIIKSPTNTDDFIISELKLNEEYPVIKEIKKITNMNDLLLEIEKFQKDNKYW